MRSFELGIVFVLVCGLSNAQTKDFEPDDFDVKCTPIGFLVSISKLRAGNLVFSFIDQSCHAIKNNTHLVASTTYNQCGTIRREFEDGTEFTNELLNLNHHSSDDLCPHLKLKVTCFYPHYLIGPEKKRRNRRSIKSRIERTKGCSNSPYAFDQPIGGIQQKFITCPFLIGIGEQVPSDGTLTRTYATHQLRVKGHKVPCKPLKNKGRLHLMMRISNDETFTGDFIPDSEPRQIEWYENVYYEIFHLGGHQNYKLVPIMCHATPDPDPENDMSYVYINNGCPVDPTVRFYSSPNGQSRFSITSFKFQNSNSRRFYSHCEVLVCDKDDMSPQCQLQCQTPVYQKRRRRNVSKYSYVKTKKGFRLIEIKSKPCYRLFFIEQIGKLRINFKVLVPRTSRFMNRGTKFPFSIVSIENENEIKWTLEAKHVSYALRDCFYRSKKVVSSGRILRNTDYGDLLKIVDQKRIILDKTHNKFEGTKSSTIECYVTVCDYGIDCSTMCARRKSVQRRRGRRDLDEIVGTQKNEIIKPIQKQKEVDVTCLEDRMIIRVKKQTQNTFHLKDSKCIAISEDGDSDVISTSYKECGTTIKIDSKWIYYTNEIIEKPSQDSLIIRGPLLKQTVRCAYRKRSVSAPVIIKLDRKPLISYGYGFYKVQIDMYQDKDYLIKNSKSLVEISEDKDMFFEVKIKSTPFANNLELHLDTCLGYNQPTAIEEQKSYVFIQDGCPYQDNTVKFYETEDIGRVRFSVKPFKFGKDRSIMINCYVTACSLKDDDSKCKELSTIGRKKYCDLKKNPQ